jgi:hypothetical protein
MLRKENPVWQPGIMLAEFLGFRIADFGYDCGTSRLQGPPSVGVDRIEISSKK